MFKFLINYSKIEFVCEILKSLWIDAGKFTAIIRGLIKWLLAFCFSKLHIAHRTEKSYVVWTALKNTSETIGILKKKNILSTRSYIYIVKSSAPKHGRLHR